MRCSEPSSKKACGDSGSADDTRRITRARVMPSATTSSSAHRRKGKLSVETWTSFAAEHFVERKVCQERLTDVSPELLAQMLGFQAPTCETSSAVPLTETKGLNRVS